MIHRHKNNRIGPTPHGYQQTMNCSRRVPPILSQASRRWKLRTWTHVPNQILLDRHQVTPKTSRMSARCTSAAFHLAAEAEVGPAECLPTLAHNLVSDKVSQSVSPAHAAQTLQNDNCFRRAGRNLV